LVKSGFCLFIMKVEVNPNILVYNMWPIEEKKAI
jgi:hypothetical protein